MQKILHKPSSPNGPIKNFTKIYKLVAARNRGGARTAAAEEERADEEERPPEADPAGEHVRRLAKKLFYTPAAHPARRSYCTPVSKAARRAAEPRRSHHRDNLEPLTYLSDLSRILDVPPVRCRSDGLQAFYQPPRKKKVKITYPTKGNNRYNLWNLDAIDGEPPKKAVAHSYFVDKSGGKIDELQLQRQSLTQFENEEKPRAFLRSAEQHPGHPKSLRTITSWNSFKYKMGFQDNLAPETQHSDQNRATKLPQESFMKYDVWNDEHSVAVAPKDERDEKIERARSKIKQRFKSERTKSSVATDEDGNHKFTLSREKRGVGTAPATLARRPEAEDNHVLSLRPTKSSDGDGYTVRRTGHSVRIIPETYPTRGEEAETLAADPVVYVERTRRLQAVQPPPPPPKTVEESRIIEDNDEFSIVSSGHSVEFVPKSYPKREDRRPKFQQGRNDLSTTSTGERGSTAAAGEGDDLAVSKARSHPGASPISTVVRRSSRRVGPLEDIGTQALDDDRFSVCRSEHSVEIVPRRYPRGDDARRGLRARPKRDGGGGGRDNDAGFDFTVCKGGNTVEIVPSAYPRRNGSEHDLGEMGTAPSVASRRKTGTESWGSERRPPASRSDKMSLSPETTSWSRHGRTQSNQDEADIVEKQSNSTKTQDDRYKGKEVKRSEGLERTADEDSTKTATPWIFQKTSGSDDLRKPTKPVSVSGAKGKTPHHERFTLGTKEYSICRSGDTVAIVPSAASSVAAPKRPMADSAVRPARHVYSFNRSRKSMRLIDEAEGARAPCRPLPAKSWEFVVSRSDHSVEVVPTTAGAARPPDETVTQVVSMNLGEERPAECLVSRREHSIGFTPTAYGRARREPDETAGRPGLPGRFRYRLVSGPKGGHEDDVRRKLELEASRARGPPPKYSPKIRLKPWDCQKAEEHPQQPDEAPTAKVNQVSDSAAPIAEAKERKVVPDTPPKHSLESKEESTQPPQQKDHTENVQESKPMGNGEGNDGKGKRLKVTSHQKCDDNRQKEGQSEENKLSSRIFNFYKSRLERNKLKAKQQEAKSTNLPRLQTEEKCPIETTKPEGDRTQGLMKEDQASVKTYSKVTNSCKAKGEKSTPGTERTTSLFNSQPALIKKEPDAEEKKTSYMSQPTLTKFKFASPKASPKVDSKTTRLQPTPPNQPIEVKEDPTPGSQGRKVWQRSFPKSQLAPKEEDPKVDRNQGKGNLYSKLLDSYRVETKTQTTKHTKSVSNKDQPATAEKKKADDRKEQVSVKGYVREIEAREKKKETAKVPRDASVKPKNLLENLAPSKKEERVATAKRSNTIMTILKQYEFVKGKTEGAKRPCAHLMEETKKEVVNWKSIDKVISEALHKKPPSPKPNAQKVNWNSMGKAISEALQKKPPSPKPNAQRVNWNSMGKAISEALQKKPLSPQPNVQRVAATGPKPSDPKQETIGIKSTPNQSVTAGAAESPKPCDPRQKTVQATLEQNQPVTPAVAPHKPLSLKQETARVSFEPKQPVTAAAAQPKSSDLKQETAKVVLEPNQPLTAAAATPPKPSESNKPNTDDTEPKEICINVATKIDHPLRFSIVLSDKQPQGPAGPAEDEVDVNIIEANRPTIKKERPSPADDKKRKERPKAKQRDVVLPPAVVDKDLKLHQEIRSMLSDLTRKVSGDLLREERETQNMIRELRSRIEKEAEPKKGKRAEKAEVDAVDQTKPELVAVKEKLYFQHRSAERPPPKSRLPRKQPVVRVEKEPSKAAQKVPKLSVQRVPKSSPEEGPKDPILNVEKTPECRKSKAKLKFRPKRSKVLKRKVSDVQRTTPPASKALFYGLEQEHQSKVEEDDPKGASATSPAPTKDRTFTTSSLYRNMLNATVEQENTDTQSPTKPEPSTTTTTTRRNLLRHDLYRIHDSGIKAAAGADPEINADNSSQGNIPAVPDQCGDISPGKSTGVPEANPENTPDKCEAAKEKENVAKTKEKCEGLQDIEEKDINKPLEIKDVTKEMPEAFENPPDGRWGGTKEGYANKLYSSYIKYSYNDLETFLRKLREKKD